LKEHEICEEGGTNFKGCEVGCKPFFRHLGVSFFIFTW
jgi:hypothetical protein